MIILPLSEIPDIVYHGTTTEHQKSLNEIRIDRSRKDLDFGQGFYTTSVYRQAKEWAEGKRYAQHRPLILTYKVDVDMIKSMNGIIFKNACQYWIEFIYNNRMELNRFGSNIDYVYGHTADGKTSILIEDCKHGILTYEEFSHKIYPWNCKILYYDQLFFGTKQSLSALEKIDEEVVLNGI